VLDGYRARHTEGTAVTVETVEVERDAVLLGITVTGPAQGARPAGGQHLWQVFTVADAQIVDIRGYPTGPPQRHAKRRPNHTSDREENRPP
jgi:hypothetical protein